MILAVLAAVAGRPANPLLLVAAVVSTVAMMLGWAWPRPA